MPCSYVIYKELRLVITTAWGNVTIHEMRTHDDQLRNDPDFRPEFNQLVDGTPIVSVEATSDQIAMAVGRSAFAPSSRRAYVAHSPSVFGMQRMITTHIELSKTPSQLAVFKDIPSALKWLGLKADPRSTKRNAQDDRS